MYHKILIPILGTIPLCTNVVTAQENQWTSERPDGHAPIRISALTFYKVCATFCTATIVISKSLYDKASVINQVS